MTALIEKSIAQSEKSIGLTDFMTALIEKSIGLTDFTTALNEKSDAQETDPVLSFRETVSGKEVGC